MNRKLEASHTEAMRVQELDDTRGMPSGVLVAVLSSGVSYSHVIVIQGSRPRYPRGAYFQVRNNRLRNVYDQRPIGGAYMAVKQYVNIVDYAKLAGMALEDAGGDL